MRTMHVECGVEIPARLLGQSNSWLAELAADLNLLQLPTESVQCMLHENAHCCAEETVHCFVHCFIQLNTGALTYGAQEVLYRDISSHVRCMRLFFVH